MHSRNPVICRPSRAPNPPPNSRPRCCPPTLPPPRLLPPSLPQALFKQLFRFVNVQLFNQLLLRRECCSFSNGEYVKTGLEQVGLGGESRGLGAGGGWAAGQEGRGKAGQHKGAAGVWGVEGQLCVKTSMHATYHSVGPNPFPCLPACLPGPPALPPPRPPRPPPQVAHWINSAGADYIADSWEELRYLRQVGGGMRGRGSIRLPTWCEVAHRACVARVCVMISDCVPAPHGWQ